MMNFFNSQKTVNWATALLLVVSFPAIAIAESGDDKAGSVAFKFLDIKNDARTASLGGLAAQGSGAQALFSNPAGIAGSSMGFSAGSNQWLLETSITNIGFVMPLAGGAIGLAMVNVDYGETMKSGWSGDPDAGTMNLSANAGSWKASDLSLQLSYAMKMSDKFSVGGSAKMVSEDIDGEKISGLAFDVGMQFDTGNRGIQMGAAITNFGSDVKPLDIPEGSTYDEFPSMSLPMTFNYGIVGQIFGNESLGLVAGMNVSKYADMAQEVSVGGELSIAGMLKIRGSLNQDNPQFPMAYGVGVNVAGISVDVSMSSHDALGSVQQFSVGYSF